MSYSKLGLDRILDVKFGLCNFENGIAEGKTKFENMTTNSLTYLNNLLSHLQQTKKRSEHTTCYV